VKGRSITVHRLEALLATARVEQQNPAWGDDYRATRPKVERKLAHTIRRGGVGPHGEAGISIDADWNLLGGAINLARLTAHRGRFGPIRSRPDDLMQIHPAR